MDQALGRLEAAAETQRQAMAGQADTASANATLSGELETLRQERDRLQSEIESIRAAHASLQATTDTVSGRLDGAIDELQSVLDG